MKKESPRLGAKQVIILRNPRTKPDAPMAQPPKSIYYHTLNVQSFCHVCTLSPLFMSFAKLPPSESQYSRPRFRSCSGQASLTLQAHLRLARGRRCVVVLCRPPIAVAFLGVVVTGRVAVWYCSAILGHLQVERERETD